MSATKREEVCSHLRYIRLELREMHQMLIKEDLMPDLNEAKEVHAQLDALLDLLSEKKVNKIKSQFWNLGLIWIYLKIIMPIIGPIPKTNNTNFAEFFVWPNFWSFKFELVWFFFDFFFFMNGLLL